MARLRYLFALCILLIGTALIAWTVLINPSNADRGSSIGGEGVAPRAVNERDLLRRALVAPAKLGAGDVATLRGRIAVAPLDAVPFFLLGVSASAAGDRASSDRLVDAALKRDPRLTAALIWKVQRAAEAQRFGVAGEYAIRLSSLRPGDYTFSQLLAALSSYPDVQRQIFAALQRNPDWRSGYIRAMSANPTANTAVYKALNIGNLASVNVSSERQSFLEKLVARQDYQKAYAAWISWLPDDALGAVRYIFDGDFTGTAAGKPFNWAVLPTDNATVGLGHGAGLTLNYDVLNDATFVTQLLLVPPGRYRLLTKIGPVEGAGAVLSWHITCFPSGRALADVPIGVDAAEQVSGGPVFEIGEDCPAQSLALKSKAQSYPGRVSLTIRSVAIKDMP